MTSRFTHSVIISILISTSILYQQTLSSIYTHKGILKIFLVSGFDPLILILEMGQVETFQQTFIYMCMYVCNVSTTIIFIFYLDSINFTLINKQGTLTVLVTKIYIIYKM